MARVTKDSIDLAEMRDTLRSAGYKLITERQQDQYAQLVRELILAEPDKVRYIQGQIQAITRASQLPKIIEDEIRAKQRKAGVEEEPD